MIMMFLADGRWLVTGQRDATQRLAGRVRQALEAADLTAYADLLDPAVRWGPPGDPSPLCRSRDQVLAWYRRGRDAGTRARVTETLVSGDRILVGLKVTGSQAAAAGEPGRGSRPRRARGCGGQAARDRQMGRSPAPAGR